MGFCLGCWNFKNLSLSLFFSLSIGVPLNVVGRIQNRGKRKKKIIFRTAVYAGGSYIFLIKKKKK